MVIKSVIVIAIAAICILAVAFAVLRYKNPIEEGFPVHILQRPFKQFCYHNLM
jgi:hydrogenase-4 membrane subunit HyfE